MVEETLHGMTVFSKLDANCGFWHIPLEEKSKHLTTVGRYYFNKLPFGICSAPELFQRSMSELLAGREGVLCYIDDVIVFSSDTQEHDARLQVVLKMMQDVGITLNKGKCEFN